MPQNNVKELIVTGPLQNVSVAYKNTNYIGDRVFRILDGIDPKAKIAVYSKGAWFRNDAGIRGPGAQAKRSGFPIAEVSFSTDEYAFASEVTDEDRRFAKSKNAPPLAPDTDAVEFATDKIDLSKEVRVSALVTGNVWADGNSGGEDAQGLWSPTGSTNTFLADIAKGVKAIQSTSGVTPNCLVIDFATYNALKNCEELLDRIKYTQRGVFTKELLAALLELEEILVGSAIVNTAKETKAGTEFTSKYIWEVNSGKGMGYLFHRPARPGRKTPAPGYQVRTAYEGGQPRRVTTWREAAAHQDVYEVAEEADMVLVDAALGYLWKDTFAD